MAGFVQAAAMAGLLQLNCACSSEACGRSRRKPEWVGGQVAAAAAAAQVAATEVQSLQAELSNWDTPRDDIAAGYSST